MSDQLENYAMINVTVRHSCGDSKKIWSTQDSLEFLCKVDRIFIKLPQIWHEDREYRRISISFHCMMDTFRKDLSNTVIILILSSDIKRLLHDAGWLVMIKMLLASVQNCPRICSPITSLMSVNGR